MTSSSRQFPQARAGGRRSCAGTLSLPRRNHPLQPQLQTHAHMRNLSLRLYGALFHGRCLISRAPPAQGEPMPTAPNALQSRKPSRKALPVGKIEGTVYYYLRKGARRHLPLPILRCIVLKLFCAGIKPKRVRFVDVRLDDDPADGYVSKRWAGFHRRQIAPSIFVDDPET